MGFRKKQSVTRPDAPRPVAQGHAAKLQRRASDLAEPIEEQKENGIAARLRRFQRQQVERQMAALRSEAVQARRLAEHIENLSRDAAAQQRKRKSVMTTDTNIVDPGHAARLKRRADDRPAPGGSQLSFNPLHPSMELPPEQLIRLLGMESKKGRKARKKRKAARPETSKAAERQAKPQPTPAAAEPAATSPREETRRPRNRQYEDLQPSMFGGKRRGLLVPALIVGVVAGIAVSAYLLWSQPVPVAEQEAAAVSTTPARQQPLKSQTASQPLHRKAVAKPAASTPPPTMNIQQQARWQAAIEKESQRLQADARQRLAKRIRQLEATTATAPVTESMALPPANTPPARPADNPPATSIQSLPRAAFERLLDKPFTTIDTPAAPQPVPGDLPAETEPSADTAADGQAMPAPEKTAPLIQDSVEPELPVADSAQGREVAGTQQPQDTFALPEQPVPAETPPGDDSPGLL